MPVGSDGLCVLRSGDVRDKIVRETEAAYLVNNRSNAREQARAVLEQAVLDNCAPSGVCDHQGDAEAAGISADRNTVQEHNSAKVRLLKKLRDVMATEIRESLSLADTVQGDFQRPKASAAATATIPYMQNCAMEYYNLFLARILFDFEAIVELHVFAAFDDVRGFSTDLKARLGFPATAAGNHSTVTAAVPTSLHTAAATTTVRRTTITQ